MKNTESLVLGIAIGAGLTYFLDPDRGGRRRALVRDQVVRAGNELEDAARSSGRHARNRAGGMLHEMKAELREDEVDDRVLEERVRSQVGRAVSSPGTVEVSASRGRVTLSGAVAEDEVESAERSAKSVRGVDEVDNRLDVRTAQEVGRENRTS